MTQPLQRHAARPRAKHRLRTWIKRILLGAIAIAALAGIIYAWLPAPVSVDVAQAHRTSLDEEIGEDGQTRVRDRYVVTAPAGGMLERIDLDAGATVERGDIVARLAPPDPVLLDRRTRDELDARLTAAVARLQRSSSAISRATVARDAAIREADRGRGLLAQGAITGTERDRLELDEQLAIRDLGATEAERSAAAAEVAAIRAMLDGERGGVRTGRTIAAPVSGRVLRVLRDSAGPVAAGAPLIELGDLRAIEVVVDVLSSDAIQLRPGMPAVVEGWGGEPLDATVRLVEPSAFTRISALGVEEQRVNVILDLDRPPATLGDGFRVDARIFRWRGNHVLTVPSSAVFRKAGRWMLYAVDHGRARLTPVTLGHRGRMAVEVVGGIEEGAVVILSPSDRVVDGERVTPRSE